VASFEPEGSRGSTLGACWIVYGVARLIIAAWLAAFSATSTVMFGALLTRVPNPYSLMDAFHVFYIVAVAWSVTCGIVGIFAGIALLTTHASARVLSLIAAFLSVSEIPLGLVLGIYTLLIFLRNRGDRPQLRHSDSIARVSA
jgi:hypothetical protein